MAARDFKAEASQNPLRRDGLDARQHDYQIIPAGRESVKPRAGFSIRLFQQRVTGPQSALDLQIVTVRIGYMETAGFWQGPGI
jgi:hypothetical protein